VLADANFPAASVASGTAAGLVRADGEHSSHRRHLGCYVADVHPRCVARAQTPSSGLSITTLLPAVLKLLPLDTYATPVTIGMPAMAQQRLVY